MKKLINLIALVMLVSTNVLTPFSYAQEEIPEVIPENEVENVEEIGETPEKDNEITEEIPNSLGEVEGEGSLPLVREVVNETSPAKYGENLEGLKEEVEDSLDAVESPTIDEDKKEDPEKSESDEVAQQEEENTKIEKQEENLEDNNEITEQENVEIESQELQKIQEISIMNTTTNSKDIILEATSTEANQTLKINKYFANAYTVDRGDGSLTQDLTGDTVHTYSVASGYTITLSTTADRWTFQNVSKSLVPTYGTTVTDVKIVSMPSLADGFGNSETNPGNYFFCYFNDNGQLTSLPEGSFDTSKITTVGRDFFSSFNNKGKLTSLPSGSFDTSKITTVGNYFFYSFNNNGKLTSLPEGSFRLATGLTTAGRDFFNYFNNNGKLTSLPEGSFDTSKITTVRDSFFSSFNSQGALTSLPTGSFDTSKITTAGNSFFSQFNYNGQITSLPTGSFDTSKITTVGGSFFYGFNYNGQITSLPAGSFDTSKITTVGYSFFNSFNGYGKLTRLPEGSFDTSKITTVGDSFFRNFNYEGQITRLPEGSFDTSKITTAGNSFFYSFNNNGQITSLPTGSFDTSKITTVGNDFFGSFNSSGALTSLPEGSFDTSKITTVGNWFFYSFNNNGQITSLPTGSFDTSNITTAGNNFFRDFNYNGQIISLPDSFKLTSAAYNKSYPYQNAFNSPNYEINKKVSDLVEGITPQLSDMNTFSDNQPGRCGVHPNWLVNPGNACKIIYDANGGTGTTTGGYNSNATSVVVGAGIKLPSMEGYALSGWLDASGNKVDEIIFPDMDGQTLYAQWEECNSGYVVNSAGTSCVLKEYTITYDLGGGYLEDGSGNQYEGNQAITYTYSSTGNKYVASLGRESVKKQDSIFLGWYTASDGGEKVDDITSINIAGETLYAHWNDCESGYTLNNLRTLCVLKEYTITYNLGGGYLEDGSGNQYEGNQAITYTYSSTGNKYVADLVWENVNRENSKFLGWYTSEGEAFDFGTIPPENDTAYAKFGCNFGYAENDEKTACEKIRVDFDANGGVFSDGETIFQKEISVVQVPNFEIKRLHSPNLTDQGEYKQWSTTGANPSGCTYPSGGNGSGNTEIYVVSTGYIQIERADELQVSIKYGGSSYCDPGPIGIWTGEHTNYDPRNPNHSGSAVRYLSSLPAYNSFGENEFSVEGDSISIVQAAGCPNYGRFVTVSGTGKTEVIEYPDNAFENIPEPTREGHSFKGWYLSDGTEFDSGNVSTGEIIKVYAKWEKLGSSGGGGGGGNTKPDTPKEEQKSADTSEQNSQPDGQAPVESQNDNSNTQDSQLVEQASTNASEGQTYTQEFQEAYEFAKGKGITTMPTIQKADMNGKLTRIAMAKMLSQYAINVLGQAPDTSKTVKFKDVTSKKDADYDNGVILAYQLGIMGINMPNNKFRPNDEVPRAEFATALSRMIYNTSDGEYKSTPKYYIHHMEKLVEEGIITKDNPNMKELRGYVMIMLMRSAK